MALLSHRYMGRMCPGNGLCKELESFDGFARVAGHLRGWTYVLAPGLMRIPHLILFAVFPGGIYIINSWYRQFETGTRMAIFYMAALITSGFGPIVSSHRCRLPWMWLSRNSLHMRCL